MEETETLRCFAELTSAPVPIPCKQMNLIVSGDDKLEPLHSHSREQPSIGDLPEGPKKPQVEDRTTPSLQGCWVKVIPSLST